MIKSAPDRTESARLEITRTKGEMKDKNSNTRKENNHTLTLTVIVPYVGGQVRIHMECHVLHNLAAAVEKSNCARAVIESTLITQSF